MSAELCEIQWGIQMDLDSVTAILWFEGGQKWEYTAA